jgi:hypothetical protein
MKSKKWNDIASYAKSNRAIWKEILHGLGLDKCAICGYDKYFYAIDYHHTSLGKEVTASRLFATKPTEERVAKFKKDIKDGILKPLCATHHREEHFRLGWIGRIKKIN